MKAPGLILFLTCLAAPGDILSDSSAFLGSRSPEYDPGEFVPGVAAENPVRVPFSPADSDFGVQQILGTYDGPPPIRAFGYFDVNYTDNAPAPTRALEDGSWYVSGLVGADWRPLLGSGWFADLGVVQEFYRFDNGNALDFESFQTHAGVVKTLVDIDDTLLYARYEYQRLTTGSWSETDYSAQRIRAGLQKDLFVRSRHQLAGGISIAYDLDANPERLERIEYAAELSYTWWIRDDLGATASWRGAYWDFDNLGREDWNHTVGLELAWRFSSNATAYSHVFYSNNDSNTPLGANDFEAWTAGVGIGLNLSF
ncbi:hypothetical protein HAHE_34420 [Haloferula helveola]|uniref:Uncharacterized protein n=1 Tax=Haloferula helveola TaxID=490095 RepID=A0ABM7RNN6_9BACT|nr:hypothetical protein HAHE_34420 [Haloferula helveola]